MSLRFVALSGTTGVTENCYLYEQDNEMIVVDCGVGFPDVDMFGVDLVIPDFSYIKENRQKVKGVLITHGHEDHIGALPFLMSSVNVPVFATKLVAGFIEDKLDDYGMKGVKINVFDPDRDTLAIGSFKVSPFRVSHSVPDGVGYCIETSVGKLFHIPDYKFDWTPVDGKPFDVAKLSMLSSGSVLALASDSLGSTTPGYTESELGIEERIEKIVTGAARKVYFTTISSNISRMQQALNVAQRAGRKVSFIGRSIDRKATIAKKLGYLQYPDSLVVNPKVNEHIPPEKTMYIISGSYGQSDSALTRVAMEEHDFLTIGKGDVVIYSSDPAPPGSKDSVDVVVDRLIEMGVDVHYYDIQENLHVSGHGSQEDIKMLMAIVKPRYFLPIGGTIRHNRAYAEIAGKITGGKASVFELKPGDVVEYGAGEARVVERIPVRQVLVDGLGVGDVGSIVLRDRQVLATEGVAIVMIQFDESKRKLITDPEVISRGFVFEGKSGALLGKAASELKSFLDKKQKLDTRGVKTESAFFLEKFFWKELKRRPMILPVVVEV